MVASFVPSGSLLQGMVGLANPNTTPNFANALSRGQVQCVLLSGRNPAAPTAALGDIWGYPAVAAGQQVRVNPTAGFTIAVISDNVNDTAAGTGARTIAISYLDTNYNPNVAVYTLNGQTAVTLSTSTGAAITNALRILGTEVLTAGSGNANAGNIFVTDSTNTYAAGVPVTTALVYDCILAGDNVDATASYTIPAGFYGMLVQLLPSINDVTATAKYGKVKLQQTDGADGIFHGFSLGGISSYTNPGAVNPALLPILLPKSDIRIQCQVSAATEVSCINSLLIWPVS